MKTALVVISCIVMMLSLVVAENSPPTISLISPEKGLVGENVRLEGNNFTPEIYIQFHDQLLYGYIHTNSSNDGKNIEFTLPQHLLSACDAFAEGCIPEYINVPLPGKYEIRVINVNETMSKTWLKHSVSNTVNFTVINSSNLPAICPSILVMGARYALNPCEINLNMIDGQGDVFFNTTIIQSKGNPSYGYAFYVTNLWDGGFPFGSINLLSISPNKPGNQVLRFAFNDSILNSEGNTKPISYSGNLPIEINGISNPNSWLNLTIHLKLYNSSQTNNCPDGSCVNQNSSNPYQNNSNQCSNGCSLDKDCVPIGYRTNNQYCNLGGSFKNFISVDGQCNNNFECSSNVCVSNQCISPGLIQRIIMWFERLFGRNR